MSASSLNSLQSSDLQRRQQSPLTSLMSSSQGHTALAGTCTVANVRHLPEKRIKINLQLSNLTMETRVHVGRTLSICNQCEDRAEHTVHLGQHLKCLQPFGVSI